MSTFKPTLRVNIITTNLKNLTPRLARVLSQTDVLGIQAQAVIVGQHRGSVSHGPLDILLWKESPEGPKAYASKDLDDLYAAALADAQDFEFASIAQSAQSRCDTDLEYPETYTVLLTREGYAAWSEDTQYPLHEWDAFIEGNEILTPDLHDEAQEAADDIDPDYLCQIFVNQAHSAHDRLDQSRRAQHVLAARLRVDLASKGPCSQFDWKIKKQ